MTDNAHDHNSSKTHSTSPVALDGVKLFQRLLNTLETECGCKLTLERLAAMTGRGKSTVNNWLNYDKHSNLMGFICLLEHLSPESRLRFVQEVCRTYPTLLHPRLAHAPTVIRNLLNILDKCSGITMIRGSSEAIRTFVLIALGHTYAQLDPRHGTAGGLCLHSLQRLVPIGTMFYIQSPASHLHQTIERVWSEVRQSSAPLLLFDGVWSSANQEMRQEILAWAKERHVILADMILPDPRQLAREAIHPVHVLTASQATGIQSRINVHCEDV